jgi:LAO/AO transport system kinase
MVRELRMMLELRHAVKAPAMDHDAHHRMVRAKAEGRHVEESPPPTEWEPPILKVVASKDQGVEELVEAVAQHRLFLDTTGQRREKERTRAAMQFITLLRERLLRGALARLERERGRLDEVASRIADRQADPYALAEELASQLAE